MTFRLLLLLPMLPLLVGCGVNSEMPESQKAAARAECVNPRPKICHKALRPVCATRDNGVRCVTTPCDSTDEVTYPNECLACQDPAVYYYEAGPCSPADEG
ncbi:MAG: hypothetical protein KJO54_09395 [Gammaproteobacteria bacterium]|nr:hypothetical protein [Gammaproteobacteria bacterium]NNF61092.1 hypothetical protein [Gammaproteobacteria bacterium]